MENLIFHACETFLFADDIFLLFKGDRDKPMLFENNVNGCLNSVLQWTITNSLSINPLKTKAIMFGSVDNSFDHINPHLGGVSIEVFSRLRCLGIILDCELSFSYHADLISGKVWGILRRIYSTNIYLPFRVKVKLAHALLMPQILYGLEVISGSSVETLEKLKRIMNMIARFVFNVRRWDHISSYVHKFLGCSFLNFVKFRNLILFFHIIKNGFPFPLVNKFEFLRSTRNPQIFIPRIYRLSFERSFVVRIARCWNYLPYELRIFSHSNNVFRLKLLKYFADHT